MWFRKKEKKVSSTIFKALFWGRDIGKLKHEYTILEKNTKQVLKIFSVCQTSRNWKQNVEWKCILLQVSSPADKQNDQK